jgi:hypothetical protein
MIRWIFPTIHVSGSLTRPATIVLDIPPQAQEQRLAALRRARDGDLLVWHRRLLCARGSHPTASAAVWFCSRSSVDRVVRLDRTGQPGFTVDADSQLAAPVRTTVLLPVGQQLMGCAAQGPTPGVWLVPFALEWRDVSGPAQGLPWAGSRRVDCPAVALCTRVGVDTRHTRRQR